MNKFLEKFNIPKLNEEGSESLNRPVTAVKIEAIIKKLLTYKKALYWTVKLENFTQLRKRLPPSFKDYSKNSKNKEGSQTLYVKPA